MTPFKCIFSMFEYIDNIVPIDLRLDFGPHFRLFYCSLNADLFELWHVTVDNIQVNLH